MGEIRKPINLILFVNLVVNLFVNWSVAVA
jgi:hypothetical protein